MSLAHADRGGFNCNSNINPIIHAVPSHWNIPKGSCSQTTVVPTAASGSALEYDSSEIIRSRRMKDMVEWIHLHFADPIQLEDIARVGQLSRSETCRYFKQMLKTSPMQYVIEYRIQKSVELLQLQERSITEIAYEVGFNSTSYFINQFRKTMQITPLKFRREVELKNKEGIEQ